MYSAAAFGGSLGAAHGKPAGDVPPVALRGARPRPPSARQGGTSRSSVVAAAWWWAGGSAEEPEEPEDSQQAVAEESVSSLLGYVLSVPPQDFKQFESSAPAPVVDAMRQTVISILGTLPPQHFRISIALDSPVSLYYLIQSCCLTGYMFANCWRRMDLARTMDALPAAGVGSRPEQLLGAGELQGAELEGDELAVGAQAAGEYAPGVQKLRVSGEVLRWRHEEGVERLPAEEYMAEMEANLRRLRRELDAQRSATRRARQAAAAAWAAAEAGGAPHDNELLRFLRSLPDERERQALTESARAGPVADAIDAFAQRLLAPAGSSGSGGLPGWDGSGGECSAVELAQLLLWSLVTGYELRERELRLALSASLDGGSQGDGLWGLAPPGLPPGR